MQIDRYSTLEKLGEGGMGVVYLAEQTAPVRRQVALKIIRPGMDVEEIVTRFEVERQALAVMDHQNIARVFDAGATEDGRPYFVMELVKGTPIHEYCDANKLTISQRLELFIPVCHAIQHAHQKGVVHRDLKPSNILVVEQDGGATPKVIDFGIAKAIGERLSEHTLQTETGLIVGTPAYMSPEQADSTGLDIDTRADVYSLGVTLYELLVGDLPFTSEQLSGLQALYSILERDPPTPSERFRNLDSREAIAARRGTESQTLTRKLHGDLDWITMKAIEKDRNRRYATPNDLGRDIQRYLSSEPVAARPPSASYRLRKFAQRHAVGVAASAVIAILLIAFAATMTIQAGVIAKERDRAELEAAKATAVNDFMNATLLAPDPIQGMGRDVTVVEALADAAIQLDSAFAGQPEVEAAARSAVGWAFFQMGRYDEAEPLLNRALQMRENVLRDSHPDLAASVQQWARVQQVRARFDSAEVLFRESIRMHRDYFGDDHRKVSASLKHLGIMLSELGRDDEGEAALRDALRISEEVGDSLEIADLKNQVGVVLWNQGKLDDLELLWKEALQIRRRHLGNEHPLVAEMLNNLAVLYDNTDRPDQAEPLYREALTLQRKLLGDDHEEVAAAASNLAVLLDVKGEYEEAEALYREALRIDRGQLGDNHPIVGHDLVNLAAFVCAVGRPREGLPLIDDAMLIYQSALEPEHWRIGNAHNWRGSCFMAMNNHAEAERELLLALSTIAQALGEDHYRAQAIHQRLVRLYESWGRPEQADKHRSTGSGQ